MVGLERTPEKFFFALGIILLVVQVVISLGEHNLTHLTLKPVILFGQILQIDAVHITQQQI